MSATGTIRVMNEADVTLATSALTATLSPDAMIEVHRPVRPLSVPAHAPGQPQGPTIRGAQPPAARSPGQARAPNNVPRALHGRSSKPLLEKTMDAFACPS